MNNFCLKGGRKNKRRFEDGHTPAQLVHIDQWEHCCENSSHGTSADNYRGEDMRDHTDYTDITIPIYTPGWPYHLRNQYITIVINIRFL